MSFVVSILITVQIIAAVAMIGLVLVQHGKGADMGAAFGGGSSGSLFGATGSANFLSRTTAVLATVFFVCTLLLAYVSNAKPASQGGSVLENPAVIAPVAPETASQIPGTNVAPAERAPVPAPAAPGPAQIPAR
jgi:preprotein translocase subunit SecG